jgi:hypothetical protein
MSIQSTLEITRETAIKRIIEIQELIVCEEYRTLENITNEPDYDLEDFVKNYEDMINVNGLKNYTNKMLENIIDSAFFRYSMFDNYSIID